MDLSPNPLCEVPATSQLPDSILLVPGATNCTVLERAYVAAEVDAAGLIVVLTEDDVSSLKAWLQTFLSFKVCKVFELFFCFSTIVL